MAHPGGRPTKFKPEYCEMLIEHMANGGSFETFGVTFPVRTDWVSRATLYVWEKEFPEFLDAKRVAQDARRMWWENVAKDCATGTAKGNPAVIIHTMKCIEPEFYSEKQIVEEKKTVELKDVDLSNLSAEELENFSSTLAKIVQK